MDSITAAMAEAADVSAVSQLVLAERECRDLGRWDRMRDCFHPDSRVRLSWIDASGPEFVERSEEMARRGMRATHRLGPVGVRLHGDRAVASLGATIDIPAEVDGVAVHLASHARFLYRAERRAHVWRLASFEAYYLRDELTPVLPGQQVPVRPEQVADFRPSYRMLSFLLRHQHFDVHHDLPGIDRPATVDTLCQDACDWAGLSY